MQRSKFYIVEDNGLNSFTKEEKMDAAIYYGNGYVEDHEDATEWTIKDLIKDTDNHEEYNRLTTTGIDYKVIKVEDDDTFIIQRVHSWVTLEPEVHVNRTTKSIEVKLT